MPTRRLNKKESHKLIDSYRDEYRKAPRPRQSEILTILEDATGRHRKSLIRLLNHKPVSKPRRSGRQRTYGAAMEDALRVIFAAYDYISCERLKPTLLAIAEHLEAHDELTLTPELRQQLVTISVSTMWRIRTRLLQDEPRLPRRTPQPSNDLRRDVPMQRIPWDEPQPGHLEVDLVFHSGPTAQGEFVHTLQMVDVATGWVALRAILGRSYLVMADAFEAILRELPFPIVELHTDNGSEFFNHHMVRFWKERVPTLQWTRNRPYVKNDARFIEQRNGYLVRGYLGRERLDTADQTMALNALYGDLSRYHNLFLPSMRQIAKERVVRGEQTYTRRRFDQARTPFARLCETGVLTPQRQLALTQWHRATNPRLLLGQVKAQIDALFDLPGAQPGMTEDVYQTLTFPPFDLKGEGVVR